jgi:hypothetical protein
MKKLFLSIGSIGILISGLSFSVAYASNPVNSVCTDTNITAGNASSSPLCQDTSSSKLQGSGSIINLIVNLISAIAGFVAVIMIVISGIQFINSGGDSKRVSQAKDTITYSLMGLVVIAIARILIIFILNKVG